MRMLHKVLAGVMMAAVAVAAVMAVNRIRDLEGQVARQAVQVERAEKRAAGLQSGADALERSAREGRHASQTWSNRLDKVQAQLAEERSTHEPLRQQIERMMQQEIVYKSQLERKESAMRMTDEGLNNLRHDLESARSLATAHAGRINQLEAEAKTRNDSLVALRRSAEEAKKSAEEAKKSDEALKEALDRTKQRLAAAEAQVADLKRAAAQAASVSAPAVTNAPVNQPPAGPGP